MVRRLTLAILALAAASLVASCFEGGAAVVVDDVRVTRLPDGHYAVDLDVTGVEHAGRDVGHYCVAVHFFAPGIDLGLTDAAPTYGNGLDDHAIECTEGLRDGDRRTVHLVSTRNDLLPGIPVRGQGQVGRNIQTHDVSAP